MKKLITAVIMCYLPINIALAEVSGDVAFILTNNETGDNTQDGFEGSLAINPGNIGYFQIDLARYEHTDLDSVAEAFGIHAGFEIADNQSVGIYIGKEDFDFGYETDFLGVEYVGQFDKMEVEFAYLHEDGVFDDGVFTGTQTANMFDLHVDNNFNETMTAGIHIAIVNTDNDAVGDGHYIGFEMEFEPSRNSGTSSNGFFSKAHIGRYDTENGEAHTTFGILLGYRFGSAPRFSQRNYANVIPGF